MFVKYISEFVEPPSTPHMKAIHSAPSMGISIRGEGKLISSLSKVTSSAPPAVLVKQSSFDDIDMDDWDAVCMDDAGPAPVIPTESSSTALPVVVAGL